LDTARIRPAEPRDLPGLVRIYNHYVTTTHVTFDTQALTIDGRRPWFQGFCGSGAHQLLVAEAAHHVVGYASSGRFRAKPAYDPSVETTIYLDPEFLGRGIGPLLCRELLDRMRSEKSAHRAFAGIALPNDNSTRLHEGFGFELVGTFREVGFKFGKYWDVSWYAKNCESADMAALPSTD